jgi:hypothetical protein
MAPGRFLTAGARAGRGDVCGILTEYVASRREMFGFDPGELRRARRSRECRTANNGVTTVTFQQQHRGIDIYGAFLRASVTSSGRIIALGSTMLNRPAGGFKPPPFELTAAEAAVLAGQAAGVSVAVAHFSDDGPMGREQWQCLHLATASAGDVRVRRVHFPLNRGELRPAWEVVVPGPGAGNVYEVVMGASDGRLLRRCNRRQTATTEDVAYRVFVSDSPAPGSPGTDGPDGSQSAFVASELVIVTPADILPWSPSGWIPDGENGMQGNNVDAHLDLDGDDEADLPRLLGDPYRVFDNSSTHPDQDPSDYSEASIVQLFYLCNSFHDRLYGLGFDEASHNFQLDNFGLGGVGGDRILAQAQDGATVNTASFATGAEDGSAAKLQVHLFTGPEPDRDGAFERDLVFHELTHGVSVRLLEALPAGAQPEALTEGWGDFVAIALNAAPGDDPHACYPFAPYIAYQFWDGYEDNYYYGLRRFPYSTDLNKNPLTYADIDPARADHPPGNPHITAPADDPHNAGEVWCMALLECRAVLMDPGRYGFEGNQVMLQLVVDGMKLLPTGQPTFLEARDAILAAELVNNAGANLDVLWEAFAKRGLGGSAMSPDTGVENVVEAFDVPQMVAFGYPDGLPELIEPNEAATIAVKICPIGGVQPFPGSATLHYSIDGTPFVDTSMSPAGDNVYEAVLPAADCGSRCAYYVSVAATVIGTVTDPPDAPASTFEALVAVEAETVLADDLETDTGWSVDAEDDDDAAKGIWSRMDPEGTTSSGSQVQPEDDHSPGTGTICWVTDGRAGSTVSDWDVDGGKTTLFSPAFAVCGAEAIISYWRWYSNDAGAYPHEDVFVVELTNDGGDTWQEVETVGPDGPETGGGWVYHEFAVTDIVAPGPEMMLRFVASDEGEGSLVEAAVDDIVVTVFYCYPPSPGDANRDGWIDLEDHALFADCLVGPGTDPPDAPLDCLGPFDFDTDLDVDLADFAEFQTMIPDTQ